MATDELKSIDITYSEQYAELLKTVTNVTKANCTILQRLHRIGLQQGNEPSSADPYRCRSEGYVL